MARADPDAGAMAETGRRQLVQLPRRADQRACALRFPRPGDGTLAARAAATEPKGPHTLGADAVDRRPMAAAPAHPPSLAERPLRRQTSKVGAGCLSRARPVLCGGRAVMRVPTAIAFNSPWEIVAKAARRLAIECTATVIPLAAAIQTFPRIAYGVGTIEFDSKVYGDCRAVPHTPPRGFHARSISSSGSAKASGANRGARRWDGPKSRVSRYPSGAGSQKMRAVSFTASMTQSSRTPKPA